ncbi:MAG: transcription-repair coupling factor [Candidatus Aminicenantes bacterium]|nr:transcription-repair coupling factor [Candidatus Aminicenantes bacterium]
MSLDFLQKTDEFQRFLRDLRENRRPLKVSGLIDQAKPYFLACLARNIERPIVYIQPQSKPFSRLEDQCRLFFRELALSCGLEVLPALAENPYQDAFPSLDAVASRMKFFHRLARGGPSPFLLLTNLFGLLKPFPSPGDLRNSFLDLQEGSGCERDAFLELIREYGYAREDIIAFPGEFAWRGGIVDVFSPWARNPYRVEFNGDEISSLREFDVSTQRSIARASRILVPSLREFPGSPAFVREWEELALKRPGAASRDRREKIEALKRGEFFPGFAFLSLLHRDRFVSFSHYLKDALFVLDEPGEIEKEWNESLKDAEDRHGELQERKVFCLSPGEIFPAAPWEKVKRKAVLMESVFPVEGGAGYVFPFQSVPRFENRIPFFLQYLKKKQRAREQGIVYLSNAAVREKLASLLAQNRVRARSESNACSSSKSGELLLLVGPLGRGFSYPPERISIFSERDIFTEEKVITSRAPRKPFVSHFQDLKENDYVVHADYGIGLFKGLVRLDVDSRTGEFMEIVYQDGDKLFVPVEHLNLVQRYSSVGSAQPALDKLGSSSWQKTKERTMRAIEKMARELLELYAKRKAVKGFSFSPPGAWESEFDRTFEYEETEDQLLAIKDIKRDMESDSSMDRLVCGDVGYGKTEVAMRAAFKAVMDGKQVAVLCPTTVLASQHLKSFRNRMVLFPVRVDALTRLQSRSEQKRIVHDLKKGLVDVVIGTHRMLSQDVGFHDLGLLIIDEEQRFGVKHKEKLKQIKESIDVLTLTATPIPRTLNLSLSGLRDISLIETPPKDRLAIHTVVASFDRMLIASAIKQELGRQGQVYYIHNKIEDIEDVARTLEGLVPQARVVFVHGKMAGTEIERRMINFIQGDYNVLISTTIIENGIDIPLVNTLIVDRADQFGLSQLYQLRGRVGRSSRQAYAYFLVPPFFELTPLARERLKALREFSELGSGFRLAAKDLEIRGAGNLLGSQQHGYMEAVGFDFFMELLDQTVKELKGERMEEAKAEINLRVDIRIPEDYLPQINLRLNLYKRVSSIERLEELTKIEEEVKDRFGPLPRSVKNLLCYGIVKHLAQQKKIKSLDRVGNKLVLKFYPAFLADLDRLSRLLKKQGGALSPQGVLALRLSQADEGKVLDETIAVLKEL